MLHVDLLCARYVFSILQLLYIPELFMKYFRDKLYRYIFFKTFLLKKTFWFLSYPLSRYFSFDFLCNTVAVLLFWSINKYYLTQSIVNLIFLVFRFILNFWRLNSILNRVYCFSQAFAVTKWFVMFMSTEARK